MATRSYNLTDNGTAGPFTHNGGKLLTQMAGTWGGGTLAAQINAGEGFVTDSSYTEDTTKNLQIPEGAQVQFVLSGASSPDLNIGLMS